MWSAWPLNDRVSADRRSSERLSRREPVEGHARTAGVAHRGMRPLRRLREDLPWYDHRRDQAQGCGDPRGVEAAASGRPPKPARFAPVGRIALAGRGSPPDTEFGPDTS